MSESNRRNLTAEVISIGDEMTSGARLDTNGQWLSRRLGELGVVVTHHTTVADTLADNIEVFRTAARRVDVVVSTGGLGPTRDDLTREALAAMVDRPLVLRQSALAHIEQIFSRRNREMPERNKAQAMFPEGSDEIFNPQGTAPGVDLAVPRENQPECHIYALPGVPAEMKRMFDDTVMHRVLDQTGGASCIQHLVMKFFGTGESDMEQRLGTMIARDRQPRVGITVSAATISLRITAIAESDVQCERMIEETRQEILERVGDLHFGDGEGFEQQHAIEKTLIDRQQTMSLIELGHAAPLGDWFAALGDTPAFRGGVSLATAEDVTRITGSADEAEALTWFREKLQSDWLLMIDEYPSLVPTPDHPQPGGDVRLVVQSPEGKIYATQTMMAGHPDILQPRIAKAAMAWMRKVMK